MPDCQAFALSTFCHLVKGERCMISILCYCPPVTSLVRHNFTFSRQMTRCFTPAISNCVQGNPPSRHNGSKPIHSLWSRLLACRAPVFHQLIRLLIKQSLYAATQSMGAKC